MSYPDDEVYDELGEIIAGIFIVFFVLAVVTLVPLTIFLLIRG